MEVSMSAGADVIALDSRHRSDYKVTCQFLCLWQLMNSYIFLLTAEYFDEPRQNMVTFTVLIAHIYYVTTQFISQ